MSLKLGVWNYGFGFEMRSFRWRVVDYGFGIGIRGLGSGFGV